MKLDEKFNLKEIIDNNKSDFLNDSDSDETPRRSMIDDGDDKNSFDLKQMKFSNKIDKIRDKNLAEMGEWHTRLIEAMSKNPGKAAPFSKENLDKHNKNQAKDK